MLDEVLHANARELPLRPLYRRLQPQQIYLANPHQQGIWPNSPITRLVSYWPQEMEQQALTVRTIAMD